MADELKFTPGEWLIDDQGAPNLIEIIVCDGDADEYGRSRFSRTVIATIADISEQEENASLIAAAPDLLDALREVVRLSDRKTTAWDKAKAAIAKATQA